MPKIKTHRGAAKRFKVTKNGKIKRSTANKRHLLSAKTSKKIRQARVSTYVHAADERSVRQMLPNG